MTKTGFCADGGSPFTADGYILTGHPVQDYTINTYYWHYYIPRRFLCTRIAGRTGKEHDGVVLF